MSAGMSLRVEILYFAALRDVAGIASEYLETDAPHLSALYAAVQARHALPLPQTKLRVAVDGVFAGWDDAVRAGSTIAFIPPVSGG